MMCRLFAASLWSRATDDMQCRWLKSRRDRREAALGDPDKDADLPMSAGEHQIDTQTTELV